MDIAISYVRIQFVAVQRIHFLRRYNYVQFTVTAILSEKLAIYLLRPASLQNTHQKQNDYSKYLHHQHG